MNHIFPWHWFVVATLVIAAIPFTLLVAMNHPHRAPPAHDCPKVTT
jgi:hypothetical protein